MIDLNTVHKGKDGSRLYHIVENDFTTIVTTKWKVGLSIEIHYI